MNAFLFGWRSVQGSGFGVRVEGIELKIHGIEFRIWPVSTEGLRKRRGRGRGTGRRKRRRTGLELAEGVAHNQNGCSCSIVEP